MKLSTSPNSTWFFSVCLVFLVFKNYLGLYMLCGVDAYLNVCLWKCLWASMCARVWRPGVDICCLPQMLFTLLTETGSLTETRFTNSDSMPSFQILGLQVPSTAAWLLSGFWGSETWSLVYVAILLSTEPSVPYTCFKRNGYHIELEV